MGSKELWTGNHERGAAAARFGISAAEGDTQPKERLLQEQLEALRLGFAETYRELYEAAQMQRRLSGPRQLCRGRFEIAAEIFPVRHVSGDFFNVSDQDATTVLAVGDIAGKGLSAAMWFTYIVGLTRMNAESSRDPAAAVSAINRQICALRPGPPLTSMFLARLDWRTGKLAYCNAGHPAPLLVRPNAPVECLQEGGPVLGAVPSASFTSSRVTLAPGDTLVSFSDGLTECRNDCDDEFGVQRLLETLAGCGRASATNMLFSVVGAVQDFAGSQSRQDDFALLVVHHRDDRA